MFFIDACLFIGPTTCSVHVVGKAELHMHACIYEYPFFIVTVLIISCAVVNNLIKAHRTNHNTES